MALVPYTDTYAFAVYLESLVRRSKFGPVLGWTIDDGSYDEIIADTLAALGDTDIATYISSADLQRLRIAGQVFLYRAILVALVSSYDVSVDGASFSRSQMLNGAKLALTMAESAAESLGLNLPASGIGTVVVPPATVAGVAYPTDPYRLPPVWARSTDD
jgi:hypothetical protein